jgi:hypothetical protein
MHSSRCRGEPQSLDQKKNVLPPTLQENHHEWDLLPDEQTGKRNAIEGDITIISKKQQDFLKLISRL